MGQLISEIHVRDNGDKELEIQYNKHGETVQEINYSITK